jgi:hypothetical protein
LTDAFRIAFSDSAAPFYSDSAAAFYQGFARFANRPRGAFAMPPANS